MRVAVDKTGHVDVQLIPMADPSKSRTVSFDLGGDIIAATHDAWVKLVAP